jgi:S-formylglutathione hydrolase FrmB
MGKRLRPSRPSRRPPRSRPPRSARPRPSPPPPSPPAVKPARGSWARPVKVTGELDGKAQTAALLVYLPAGYAQAQASLQPDAAKRYPLVLALHGWNHTPELFRDKGKLERWADLYGVVIAVPAMGKTVYETAFYPESKKAWGAIPGTRWVGEVILPYVRKSYAVYGDRAHTAVIGYSTGGRGAVLLAEAYPEFAFAGSASGTFDLMRLDPKDGEYKIHAVIYGPRDKFAERWERDNCVTPARLHQLDGTAIYAVHSGQDKVVKPDQLEALRKALDERAATRKNAADAQIALQPEGGAHDWPYWVTQWEPMFKAMGAALGLPAVAP